MNRTAENDQKGREFSLAMRDDIVASIWQGRPGMWGDALTHFAMADRAEELRTPLYRRCMASGRRGDVTH